MLGMSREYVCSGFLRWDVGVGVIVGVTACQPAQPPELREPPCEGGCSSANSYGHALQARWTLGA